jgi:diacylglycerol O-acyltransferase-1
MSTLTGTEAATATPAMSNGRTAEQVANSTARRTQDTKYRHVFATHSVQRESPLSHDAEKTPSFVGFRNLMVLVLSTPSFLAMPAEEVTD